MKKLSLYVHIPFCIKKCNYCDFLSYSVGRDCIEGYGVYRKKYIDALCNEIRSYKYISEDYIIDTIFIGGGTPSVLLPGDISRIVLTIKEVFDISGDAEITIEANPGTLSIRKAEEYISCGINRLSIGLQSANDNELRMLGRVHNYDQFVASFDIARQAGFRNINIDIMSALPAQDIHSYLDTLEKVLKCRPEHISSYSLIIEEGTPISLDEELLQSLPDEDTERKLYEATDKVLSLSGYNRYEISNYAKKGFECRHNMVYWTLKEYIGLGIGASSFFKKRRFCNTKDINTYINCEDSFDKIRNVDEELNSDRLMEEYMFLGLRMTKGVSAASFNDYFSRSIYDIYGDVIGKYVNSGHMTDSGGIISLTNKGIDVSNVILADFLL